MSGTANHIAIVGMAGRFPGAADVAAFWRVLVEGTDAIGHFSDAELEHRNADALPGVRHVGARGVLDRVDEFDAEFFGITPREAELMDPQHRLFLQCCWHALEDAGHDPAQFAGLIGVYAGVSLNTYLLYNLQAHGAGLAGSYQVGAYQTMLGNDKDFMPTRVSYKLGLRGPSMAVQTACSTSLVAVAQACQALLSYQADLCLAGGVSISFPQKRDYPYTEDAMVSPDGRCRPFDAEAQGTVFGHGVGVVALRRLDDALAHGDHILAVIRGSAVNNDGAGKIGFAAPSVEGQAAVITMAQAVAEVDPASISYIEAHGTGTPLGDPIEVAALTQAFRRGSRSPLSCTIGTGKGHIGHLDVASGVTGLIKTVLQLHHRQIPAVLNFRAANPRLDLAQGAFRIADRLQTWNGPRPLRAGVSAFGVGGTNAHVVVEEAPTSVPLPCSRPHQLLIWSARNPEALARATANLHAHLTDHDLPLAEVAYTLQTGRRAFNHRRIVVCDSRGSAIHQLSDAARLPSGTATTSPGVAFLFPGQGAQHAGMAAGIYHAEPLFRQEIERLCALAEAHLGFDLRTLLFPTGDPAAAHERLRQTDVAQPALFIVSLALAKLWRSWGVSPQALIGHSVGEYVAATIAGVMAETDALRLVAVRGRLIQALPPGTMLSVRLSEAALLPRLPNGCSIAAVNGPQLCVASGPEQAIAEWSTRLTAEGIVCRPLMTSHAFHSAMMDPILPRFAEAFAQVRLSPPSIPIVSGVSGTWLTAAEATDPDYWVRHVRATVRFADAAATLRRDHPYALLEVGPGRTLTTLARQAAADDPRAMIASLPTPAESSERAQPVSDTATLLEAVGRLWLVGVQIDWAAFHAREPRRRVSLPGYPFATTRFWIAPPAGAVLPPAACPTAAIPPPPTESPASMAPAPTPPTPTGSGGRRATLLAGLRTLLSELSGTPPDRLDPTANFIELGFDSLMLTQVSMAIQSRFKGKITFRQLLGDIGSLDALADHLDRTLPAEAFAAAPASPPRTASPLPPASGNESALEQLIRRQMEMMAEQLTLLRGSSAVPAVAVTTTAAAATTATTTPTKEAEFKAFGPYKPIQRGPSGGLTSQQQATLDRLIARYTTKTAKSKELTQLHRSHLADPRVAAGFRAQWKAMVYPIITSRSKGTRLWDVDGNEYIDLLNGFGCILFGHAPDFVVEAVNRQMAQGYEIGPQTLLAGEAAKLMCEMTGLDRATFCNTGSEAVMAAMRLARTVTGRMRIVSFLGDYHGTFDEVLAKSVGDDHRSLPIAPGIPQGKVDNLTVLPYGTDESLAWIRAHADELAAVLIEPVQSRHPALQPKAFIQEVRRITAASGSALIMDEVITGFRTHPGGAQALFGVTADLASYGKVIGGGMPIGVLCGNRRFMDALDGGMWQYGDDSFPEVGVTFFAGTFVRHPATMAAVVACLERFKREGGALQEAVNAKCTQLVQRLAKLFHERGVPSTIEHFSSWFYFTFAPEHRHGSLLYYLLRERGVHIQEGFPCFLTTAHTDADLERVYQAFASAIDELVTNGFFPDPSGRVNEHERDQSEATAPATTASTTTVTEQDSGTLVLSESQHEIWLAAQFATEASCAYNESVTIRLHGSLQADLMDSAWARLVERHPALRIRIAANGETQEVVDRRLPITHHDWRGSGAEERLANLLSQEAATAFDLATGPLVRVHLVRLSEVDHALVITAHHIICDGWSMNVLCDEWGRLYSALSAGQVLDLAPTMGFPEYVRRVQQRGGSSEAAETTTYWTKRFSDIPTLPDLPTDRPRPTQRGFHGATAVHHLSATTYQRIKQAGAKAKATLFTTLMTGFQLLVARLTGQFDVVVGVPTAGQALMGEDGDFLVGHCVNFLPLRAQIRADANLAEQLPVLQRQVLDDFAHQEFTYGQLVRSLKFPRDPNRLPLTEIQFNLERWVSALAFTGLTATFSSNPKRFVNFDLFLNVVEDANGLHLHLDYNTGLYDQVTVQRWLRHYETLLSGFADAPLTSSSHLPLLTDAERASILQGFNRTHAEYPRDVPVHQLVARQAEKTPDAIAVTCDQRSLTYRQLHTQVELVTALLRARGAGPQRPVAVCLPRTELLPVVLLGVLGTGAAYIPLDATYPIERLKQVIEDARPSLVVTQSAEWAPFVSLGVDTLLLAPGWDREHPAAIAPAATPQGDDLVYIIFTSGSTGRPKGVCIPHRALTNFLWSMRERPGMDAQDTLVSITTISFDIAALELFLPLVCGARLVIAPRDTVVDGRRLAALLAQENATVFQATPVTMRMLVEAGWTGNPRLRLLCGGEAVQRDLADQLLPRCDELWNMYGPTETTVWSSVDRIEAAPAPILIGSAIANTSFHILDRWLQPQPIGIVGELFIGGDGVAAGYLHREDLTAERFIPTPFASPTSQRLYRSGDLGRYHPDGRIEFLGRTDHQVKIRGFRIEIGDIEQAISQHPAIRDRVVIARGSAENRQLMAYVVVASEQTGALTSLRQFLRERLPDYMVPSAFIRLDALPLTPNGKIDRNALPQGPADGGVQPTARPLIGKDELNLGRVWQDVLGISQVGPADDFFALGGNSLSAFRVVNQLESLYQRRFAMGLVFKHPVLSDFAAQIGSVDEHKHNILQPIRIEGTRPPFFFIGGFLDIGRHTGEDQPFYALDVPAEVKQGPNAPTFGELADRCITEMRRVQPTGPYHLGGHCFGAMVAFAIANQLQAEGEQVAFLALLDPPDPPGSTGQSHLSTRILFHLRNLVSRNPLAQARYLMERFRNIRGRMNHVPAEEDEAIYSDFKPTTFTGNLCILIAKDTFYSLRPQSDPRRQWKAWANGSTVVIECPGDHVTFCREPFVKELAQHIRHHMDQTTHATGTAGVLVNSSGSSGR
jgi:amino acid adenylation domain-containing protein